MIIGSVEHFITSSLGNSSFVNAYNFFNNAASIGVQRIAYNTGSAPAAGMNFEGEVDQAGDNAWALFKFASTQVPFYLLIQYSQTASLGAAGGFPATSYYGLSSSPPGLAGFFYQIAQRRDGGNPWNGSTANAGSDVKGNPVWTTGSSDVVAIYPPVNSRVVGITTASIYTSSHYMRGLSNGSGISLTVLGTSSNINYPVSCRMHLLADEDNVLMLMKPTPGSSYCVNYFGKLKTTTQSYSRPRFELPYFYFSSYNVNTDPAVYYWAGYPNALRSVGTVFGGNPPNGFDTYDGGAMYHSASLGMGRLLFDQPTRHRLEWFRLNYNFDPPKRDAVPLNVWFKNDHYFTGTTYGLSFAGTTSKFLSLIGDVTEHDVDENYEFACIGGTGAGSYFYNQTKFLRQSIAIPWGGGIIPGTSTSRTGVQF